MNDVRIIQNGLLLNLASFADYSAALGFGLIDAGATGTNGSLSGDLPAGDLPSLTGEVMSLSGNALGGGGRLPGRKRR